MIPGQDLVNLLLYFMAVKLRLILLDCRMIINYEYERVCTETVLIYFKRESPILILNTNHETLLG
jgi:hypothetical protein